MFKVLKNSVLYIILFLAFAVRTFAIFLLGKDVKPELYEYNTLALNIIHGKGYIYHFMNTDHRTFCYPGYSYLIAFIHWLTHENYLILELFQVLLSVISCALLYLVASRLFGKKVGLLAAFLMAMHPGLVIYTTKIHDLSFVVLIITLIFWLMLKLEPGRLINNVLIGIVIGVGVLTRPTLIFFLPVYFFYHYFRSKNLKSYVLGSFAVFAFVCLTIMPWTIRNFNIHNRLIFITTTSAEQFWRGNNALSSGTSFNLAGKTMAELAPKEFIDKIFNMTEIEQYDFYIKRRLGLSVNIRHFLRV